MKKIKLSFLLLGLLTIISCTRVEPNYVGVLMENYGKSGKSDFSLQKGKVNTNGIWYRIMGSTII